MIIILGGSHTKKEGRLGISTNFCREEINAK